MTTDATSSLQAVPSLQAAIPILLTGDLAGSVAFFERLGFERLGFEGRHVDDAYAILHRDGVQLHFSALAGLDPKQNNSKCRVDVQNVEALYETFPPDTIDPNGALSLKPYGMREFVVLDPSGIAVMFGENAS